MSEHDRLEAQYEAGKARQKAADQAELLEVLAMCKAAIRTARVAICRQYDTGRALEELGIAEFQAKCALAKYTPSPAKMSEKEPQIPDGRSAI